MAPGQVPPNNFPNTLANYAIRQYARGMTTSPESRERDELTQIIFDSRKPWVTNTEHRAMEQGQAEAILAAGYRKPRTITTVEELHALGDGAVLRDSHRDIIEVLGGKWYCGDFHGRRPTLPATVLWEPEA